MERVDAIRKMLMENPMGYKDCVDFVCRYLTLVWGREFPYPSNEDHINAKAVSRYLGKSKRKGEYGDVMLYDDGEHAGVGIEIGARRMATVTEHLPGMEGKPAAIIQPLPSKALYWSV